MKEAKAAKSKDFVLELVFFAIIIVALFLVFNPTIFLGGDNGYYISLSHSILREFSYNTYWQVGSPPEVAIPPGYPVILAIIQLIFGYNLIAMKIFSLISYLVALIFLYKLLLLFDINKWVSFGAILFMSLSPVLNEYSHWVLTEAPFLGFSSIGIFYIEKYIRAEKATLWKLFLPSILLTIAVYIRIPAVTILPAVFVYIWLRKDFKTALLFGGIIFAFLLPWVLRVLFTKTADGVLYFKSLTQSDLGTGADDSVGLVGLFKRILLNLWDYTFEKAPSLFIPQRFGRTEIAWIDILIGAIVLALVILGFYRSFKTKQYFSSLFILFTMGLLAINQHVRLRYMIILFPFLIHLMSRGVEYIAILLDKEKLKNWLMGGLISILLVFGIIEYVGVARINMKIMNQYAVGNKYAGMHPVYIKYFETATWIKKNTPKDAKIVTRKPRLFYIMSGRKCDMFLKNPDTEVVVKDIVDRDIDYVIIDQIRAETGHYLVPAVNSRRDIFQPIYKTAEPTNFIIKVKDVE